MACQNSWGFNQKKQGLMEVYPTKMAIEAAKIYVCMVNRRGGKTT